MGTPRTILVLPATAKAGKSAQFEKPTSNSKAPERCRGNVPVLAFHASFGVPKVAFSSMRPAVLHKDTLVYKTLRNVKNSERTAFVA